MQDCKRNGTKRIKVLNFTASTQKKIFIWRFRMPLFNLHSLSLSLSFSLYPPQQLVSYPSNQTHISLSHASSHESWFKVSRLYSATLIKIKIKFSILLLTRLRLKVETLSTLISLSYKLFFSKCSLFSLFSSLSSDFKISLFYFETNKALYSFTSKSF